jgi:hypothetical protein
MERLGSLARPRGSNSMQMYISAKDKFDGGVFFFESINVRLGVQKEPHVAPSSAFDGKGRISKNAIPGFSLVLSGFSSFLELKLEAYGS